LGEGGIMAYSVTNGGGGVLEWVESSRGRGSIIEFLQ